MYIPCISHIYPMYIPYISHIYPMYIPYISHVYSSSRFLRLNAFKCIQMHSNACPYRPLWSQVAKAGVTDLFRRVHDRYPSVKPGAYKVRGALS